MIMVSFVFITSCLVTLKENRKCPSRKVYKIKLFYLFCKKDLLRVPKWGIKGQLQNIKYKLISGGTSI